MTSRWFLPIALLLLTGQANPPAECKWVVYEGTVVSAGPIGRLAYAPVSACFYNGTFCDPTGNEFEIRNKGKSQVHWSSFALGVKLYTLDPEEAHHVPLPDKYCGAPSCFKPRSYEVSVTVCE